MEWQESECEWIVEVRQGQINEVDEKDADRVETVIFPLSRSSRRI